MRRLVLATMLLTMIVSPGNTAAEDAGDADANQVNLAVMYTF